MKNHVEKFEGIVKRFGDFAQSRKDIRTALIVGSRARNITPADEWSDLDVIFASEHPEFYIDSPEWLQNIGDYSITFIEKTAVGGGRERRVLFEEELDVDFAIFGTEHFKKLLLVPETKSVFEKGARVLFDKDEILKTHNGPEGNILEIRSRVPSEAEFENLINDFWYHAVWSVKKLSRGELWTSKSCVDGYMKRILLRFIEWHAKAKNGPDYETWHDGRFFDSWADERFVKGMRDCFSLYDEKDVGRALVKTMELFRLVAVETSELCGCPYPDRADGKATDWVKEHLSGLS